MELPYIAVQDGGGHAHAQKTILQNQASPANRAVTKSTIQQQERKYLK